MHTDPGRIKYTQRITRTQSRPAGGHAKTRPGFRRYRTERRRERARRERGRAGPTVLGAGSPSRAGEVSGPARRGCTCERERSRVGCDRPTTSPKGARRARTARRELAKLRGRKRAPCAHARTHAEASHRAARRLPSGTRPADQPTAAGVPRTADGGGAAYGVGGAHLQLAHRKEQRAAPCDRVDERRAVRFG